MTQTTTPAPRQASNDAAGSPSLVPAAAAGFVAAVAGGALWATVVYLSHYKTGIMAILVGVIVGWVVGRVGRRGGSALAITGAVLALLGCVLGTLFTAAAFASADGQLSLVGATLAVLSPGVATGVLKASLGAMDIVFYGIAVYEGYKFAMRPAT